MPSANEPIAIIGAGCRFPAASNTPSSLWSLLTNPGALDTLSEIPRSRFNWRGYHTPTGVPHHGTIKTKYSHFLSDTDISAFDATFFNIKPADAEAMDPQQRLLLETVYEGLENAGLTMEGLRGSDTAVYIGLMNTDYADLIQDDVDCIPAYAGTGVSRSIHANRISWFFDWRGPSMSIDTACSSSMMAVHLAVQSLRSGEARVAVAAGASLYLSPHNYIVLSSLGMISSSGRSRMWDARADGYSRGEGVASLILKPLSAAIADGDAIDAIIRETGANHDGYTRRITAPSSQAQAELIRRTYARAGLRVDRREDRPQYFEAHGTGTAVGDPREAEAVCAAFFGGEMEGVGEEVMHIGSVKTVIGHTEATAGIAGILKAALAVKYGVIPPNLLFERLSPAVEPFAKYLSVPTELKPWPVLAEGGPRRASVNAFGFGGSNGHVILESYQDTREPSVPPRNHNHTQAPTLTTPFVFSAQSERSLISMVQRFAEYLEVQSAESEAELDLRSIAYTLQYHKSLLGTRTSISALDKVDLVQKLKNFQARAPKTPDLVSSRPPKRAAGPRILGIFTGQGAQWAGMAQSVLHASPKAREIVRALDKSLTTLPREQDRPSWTIEDELMKAPATSQVAEAALSQPLCTAIQILLVDMLRSAGVRFHAVVGHSSGEIAAAYAAGFVTAADAIRIAYYRGRCANLASGRDGQKGTMLACGLSPDGAREICDAPRFRGRIGIAACNSSTNTAISGDVDAVNEVKAKLEQENIFARLLKVDTAYHSHHMLPCAQPYLEALHSCDIRPLSPEADSPAWLSSVQPGDIMSATDSDKLSGEYWVTNMTSPVLFADAVSAAVTAPDGSFDLVLEVGPHPALQSSVQQTIQETAKSETKIPYTGVLARERNGLVAFADALGTIWTHCAHNAGTVTFATYDRTFFPNAPPSFIRDLPTYPWDHTKTYWYSSRWERARRNRRGPVHSLLGVPYGDVTDSEVKWRNFLIPKEIPWLLDHRVQGGMVFPAAGYAVMAVEAAVLMVRGEEERGQVKLVEILDLDIRRAISFEDESSSVEVILTLTNIERTRARIRTRTRTRPEKAEEEEEEETLTARWTLHSPATKDADTLSLVCRGSVCVRLGPPSSKTLPDRPTDNVEGLPNMLPLNVDDYYATLSEIGYGYSGPFKRITSLRRKMGYSSGVIALPDPPHDTLVHPALLDAAFQALPAAISYPGDGGLRGLRVPTGIGAVRINPYYFGDGETERDELVFDAAVPMGSEEQNGGDVSVYTTAGHGVIQIEAVKTVPLTEASAADDRNIFSEEIWALADPDTRPDLVCTVEPTADGTERAFVCERAVHFYSRRLWTELKDSGLDKQSAALHHQHLIDWAGELVSGVAGERVKGKPEWEDDTEDDIQRLFARYPADVDLRLIKRVGETCSSFIKGDVGALDPKASEDVLNEWYAEGLGWTKAYAWAVGLVKQIVHRYPRMDIISLGGTSGTARTILDGLGSDYTSYTYTYTSTPTQEQSTALTSARNVLAKPLDLSTNLATQGYTEHSYDLVLATNLTHSTSDVSEALHRIYSLLKPGGYLVLIEPTNQASTRMRFLMGGLAKFASPVSPAQWHSLLQKTGYSGVDTILTSSPNGELVCPFSVFLTQAVDRRVSILRQPLFARVNARAAKRLGELLIIGGRTLETAKLASDVQFMLGQFFCGITAIETLEEVNTLTDIPSTILVLSELERPMFQDMSTAKLDALKTLWSNDHNVLWVTRGCTGSEPHANTTIGMARSVRNERKDLRLQILDVEDGAVVDARRLAEMLLRLRGTQLWEQEGALDDMLWTTEPEYRLTKDGRFLIPRLSEDVARNRAYNSRHRRIQDHVDLAQERVSVRYVEKSVGFKLVKEPDIPASGGAARGSVIVRVLYSLLCAVKLADGRCLFPLIGTRTDTEETVFALSSSNGSLVEVPMQHLVPVMEYAASGTLILRVAWELLSHTLCCNVTPGQTILARGIDPGLFSVLRRHAGGCGVSVYTVTSKPPANEDTASVAVHPLEHRSTLRAKLPANISVFLDMSPAYHRRDELHRRLASVLPVSSKVYTPDTLFSTGSSSTIISPYNTPLHDLVAEALNTPASEGLRDYADELTCPLRQIPHLTSSDATDPFTLIDWTADVTVPVNIAPTSDSLTFSPDKTYLLVGLTGDLGQTLAEWFMQHGAKHLILASRNPSTHITQKWLDEMQTLGVITLKIVATDITDTPSLTTLYTSLQNTPTIPPIAGVVNAAMVLQDSTFANTTLSTLESVTGPKVSGSQNLHALFDASHPLDFFILLSSLSYIVGNAGQTAYAAANAFMAGLVAQRRKAGLAASVMHIGPILGAGHIARHGGNRLLRPKALQASGVFPLSVQDFLEHFAEAVRGSPADSGVGAEIVSGLRGVRLDAQMDALDLRDRVVWGADPRFGRFVEAPGLQGEGGDMGMKQAVVSVRDRLMEATSAEQARSIIRECFSSRLAFFLRLDAAKVETSLNLPLNELGMDSLVAVETRNWFSKQLGVDVSIIRILSGASVLDLVEDALVGIPAEMIPNIKLAGDKQTGEETKQGHEGDSLEHVDVEIPSPSPVPSIESSSPDDGNSLGHESRTVHTPPTSASEPELDGSPVYVESLALK
ncbi:Polyketide synthase-nonribosomal peptide synthetase [Aspergillus mulundensis]|uniref:Polyketide synthase-nonribosomal peptide synthetase n=1 Tax=Aspergillus mulundensis TaxID=1810919 RepID=A0A3D8R3Z4_9EURO|nr:Polyketide synthase-nonribosomal peptide synthetase [Aspergillus mulundensis]RDW68782.1 Polyketide synthase-nonribosomal peptide synthetase [Aspergillus mulundensis]